MMQLPCRCGFIYPFAGDRLAVEVVGHPKAAKALRALAGVALRQDGDREQTFVFPVGLFDKVAAILTFKAFGRRRGFSEQRAHASVTEELNRLNFERSEAAHLVLRLELERLDALLAAIWDKAIAGDLRAIDRLLSIMARRSKLLGLDAPERHKHELTGADHSPLGVRSPKVR